MDIVFRCDSSLSIGSGHLLRCRILARVLQLRGFHITFLCRRHKGNLIHLIQNEFRVIILSDLSHISPLDDNRSPYASTLGCTQIQDADDCIQSLIFENLSTISWVVVDHYALDSLWECHLISSLSSYCSPRLMVIDDLADRAHSADILLDQNYFGKSTQTRYVNLLPHSCRLLLGPHYALTDPLYSLLHPYVVPRIALTRVLIFFGGVDPFNLTSLVLQVLLESCFDSLHVDIVLGASSPHRTQVKELVSQRTNTILHSFLPSLAPLIMRADLAIGSGGSTTWERSILGLPSLVITYGDDQLPISKALASDSYITFLGHYDSVSIDLIRSSLLDALSSLTSFCSGLELTDGWGVQRVASSLVGCHPPISLSKALVSDEALFLRWVNETSVRKNSFSHHLVTSAEHHEWFHSALKNPNCLIFVARDSYGCPLGQIRFDRVLDSSFNHEVLIDFSLDSCFRGFGISSQLLRLGLEDLAIYWGHHILVSAYVLQSNTSSHACFARLGFQIDNSTSSPESSQSFLCWRLFTSS